MLDLIYVNVIIVLFDILVVILLYLNQVGISHPIQTFGYALKLKLEFVVLNQLMAVAARGLQREYPEERRYHHSSVQSAFSAECRRWGEKAPIVLRQEHSDSDHNAPEKTTSIGSAQLVVPEAVLSRGNQMPRQSTRDRRLCDHSGDNDMNKHNLGTEQDLRLGHLFEDDGASTKARVMEDPWTHSSQTFSGKSLQLRKREDLPANLCTRCFRETKAKALRSMRYPFRHDMGRNADMPRRGGNSDEEDEIGVHMWENNTKLKLETPWFQSTVEA